MPFILALFLGLWASVANADFLAGVVQQQQQQAAAPSGPTVLGEAHAVAAPGTITVTPDATVGEGQYLAILFFTSNTYAGNVYPTTADGTLTAIVPAFDVSTANLLPGAAVWGKVGGASEPSSYTFSLGGARDWAWIAIRFSAGTLFDTAATVASPPTGTVMTLPSITTANANTLLLRSGLFYGGTVPGTFSGGVTEIVSFVGSDQALISVGYEMQAVAGASATATLTHTLDRNYIGHTIGLY